MEPGKKQPPHGERCRSVLSAALLGDERVIAEGRANELHAGSGYLYLFATHDRVLWTSYLRPERVFVLPFALVTALREEYDSHRYLLRMRHEPVMRMERAPRHRILWLTWGDTFKPQERRETHFLFSRRATRAAQAIREQLLGRQARPSQAERST